MAIQELDELFSMLTTPEDKQALEQILTRNQPALEHVKSGNELFKAFVDGDRAAISQWEQKNKTTESSPPARTTTTPPPSVTSPALDMSKLDELVDARARALFDQLMGTETFTTKVTGLVKKTADELAPGMYSTASRTANEIYDIKFVHKDEFGQPLDMTKFNEFLEANKVPGTEKSRFPTLTDAHNAFVTEDRIQNRIKKGVADEREAERVRSAQVPGNTLGKSPTTMADMFVLANKTKQDVARGEGLDQAAQALYRTRQARTQ